VEFSRPIYAGNAILKIKSSDSIKVVTVRTTAFDKAAVGSGSASVEEAEALKGECESSYRSYADL
jgi:electron transfer flavoprotein alpha subunit